MTQTDPTEQEFPYLPSDTPFRRYMREQVHDAARNAIEENARRHTYRNPAVYQKLVDERLKGSSKDCIVLAFCADKPESLDPEKEEGYFGLFREFAKDRVCAPSPIVVCRLFPKRGKVELEGQLKIAFNMHMGWRKYGVMPLQVDLEQLEPSVGLALARANERECFGFLVFLDPNGGFAITHAGKDKDFRFSEWRRAANVRQFVSLFDKLLVRSDEFRAAVETDEPPLQPLRDLRSKLRAIKERPRPVFGSPSYEEILEESQPIGWPGVHVIGSFARRSTFYQTQVRALNLAWALLDLEKKSLNIAVIGGGIAGLTFAAAALRPKLGHTVHLFTYSKAFPYLGPQRKSERHLHPHIYDWPPRESATKKEADLPVLTWEASQAREVATKLNDKFNEETKAAGCRYDHFDNWSASVNRHAGRYRLLNMKKNKSDLREANIDYDLVIFAVGMGREWVPNKKDDAKGYWKDTGWFRYNDEMNGKHTVLVVGNGDGGLVDLAVATIPDYDQGKILDELKLSKDAETALLEIELTLDEIGPSAKDIDLWNMYDHALEPFITEISRVFSRRVPRNERRSVTFCCGHQGVFRPDTSALNRFVAYLVLKLGDNKTEKSRIRKVDVRGAPVRVWFDERNDDQSDEFDVVVLRLGTAHPKDLEVKWKSGEHENTDQS